MSSSGHYVNFIDRFYGSTVMLHVGGLPSDCREHKWFALTAMGILPITVATDTGKGENNFLAILRLASNGDCYIARMFPGFQELEEAAYLVIRDICPITGFEGSDPFYACFG